MRLTACLGAFRARPLQRGCCALIRFGRTRRYRLALELVSQTFGRCSLAGLDAHPLFPKLDRTNLNVTWAGAVLDGLQSAQPSSAFVAAGS